MTFLLGLTGSIGMGKSTTAQMFRDEGIPVWDADETVHRLYQADGAGARAIAIELPEAIENGAVSRPALKKMIAADLSVLAKLESVIHPLVAADRERFISRHPDAALAVFDIPLLFETSADAWLDAVAVVSTDLETQKQRVLAREGMTQAQFNTILARQMSDADKRARADYIIPTDSLDGARAAVRHVITTVKQGKPDA